LKETEEVKVVTQHVPIGVVAGITPWNYPFQLAILKIEQTLVTGCTIILKPSLVSPYCFNCSILTFFSPFTPYTALKIGEIAAQIFSRGVIQVLGGDDNLGPWITEHPDISKISFAGSTATGKRTMAAAAATLKRVNLEQ
jgi:acyl-CoA reductase-like NAD-dependent aldehyde dehydrogenase